MKEYPEDKTDHDLVEEAKVIIARRNGRAELNAVHTSHLWEDLCILFHELKEKEESDRSKRLHTRRMKAIDDIDPKEIIQWLADNDRRKSSGIARVRKHVDLLSPKDLDEWFKRFFKWEKDLEERAYKNGVITVSNFFSALDDLVREDGVNLTNEFNEDFLSTVHVWRKYTFKLYCGQGCFTRIIRSGKQVFQTT